MLDLDRHETTAESPPDDQAAPPVGWGPYIGPEIEPSRLARWRRPLAASLGIATIGVVIALAYVNRSTPVPEPQWDQAQETGVASEPGGRSAEGEAQPTDGSSAGGGNSAGGEETATGSSGTVVVSPDPAAPATVPSPAPTDRRSPSTTTAPSPSAPTESATEPSTPTPTSPSTTEQSSPSTTSRPRSTVTVPSTVNPSTPSTEPVPQPTTPPSTVPQGPGPDAILFNGNWYEAIASGQNWPAASKAAADRGGHLVHIDSRAENDFIRDTFAGPQPVWIGMKDTNGNGIWTLTDGTRAEYVFWREGRPDNATGNEFYARMAYPGGRWDDGARNASTWFTGTRFVESESLTVVEFEG